MNELALFAGAGGGILGGLLHGWRTVAAVEIEDYPRRVLLQRQADGILPKFPIWDDVRTFDGKQWRGKVDVISGGFPCQDISAAGAGAGIDGERSGLWKEMARIVDEVRPRYVFVENSPMLTSRGLGTVLGDLATLGYNARWGVLGACDVGAPHKRERIWILADSYGLRELQPQGIKQDKRGWSCDGCETVADASCKRLQRGKQPRSLRNERDWKKTHGSAPECRCAWWDQDPAELSNSKNERVLRRERSESNDGQSPESDGGRKKVNECRERGPAQPFVGRVANGVANRIHRLKAIGNGQIPAVAHCAFEILRNRN